MVAEQNSGENDNGGIRDKKLDEWEELVFGAFKIIGTSRKLKFTSQFLFDFLSYSSPNYSKENTKAIEFYKKFIDMPYQDSFKEVEEALMRLVAKKILRLVSIKHRGPHKDEEQYKKPVYRQNAFKLF